ncbi:MAG: hypothetical protein KAX49_17835, partial [Halanaerobiales bacterium]|nr:hypothetical protein [Halanaerobiales bacterium]
QGGLGDLVTYLARLDSLLQKEDKVKFAIRGGFPKAIEWEREILSADSRVIEITEGTIPEADKILDWRSDHAPLGYPIQIPFEVQIPKSASISARKFLENLDLEKTVVIHPRTTEGNIRGFEPERHWDDEKWIQLVNFLRIKGLSIVRVGSKSDYFPLEGITDLVGKTSILETIGIILLAKYCIDVNSFIWEISCYAGHPTVVLYFHNPFWIPLHVPENIGNLYLETDKEIEPRIVMKKLLELGNG